VRLSQRTPVKTITVLLVEDHMIVREGLRALLKRETDLRIVGEAENGRQAFALTRKLRPSVVVMDIGMPLLNGLEAARQVLAAHPKTKILILSAHSDNAYVEKALALGASGYLVKQTSAHVLAEAIRKVWLGMRFFSPVIARRLDHQQLVDPGKAAAEKDSARLTPREMEVLQLIAEGKANKQTAAELHISIKTVEKHRQSMMNKLDIHDTAGLTRHAIAIGIIESSVQATVVPPPGSSQS